jgi:hypothetical protein
MDYQITKEIRIHHEDGWFYQFTDDGEGCIEVEYYELIGNVDHQVLILKRNRSCSWCFLVGWNSL